MMKTFCAAVLALVFLAGCAGIFPSGVPRDPVERLRYDLDRLLDDSLFIPTRAGVKVVSLESGEVLYDRNSTMLMHPASNMKLLTSAAAIGLLGKDFPLTTVVFADTMMAADTLEGNLYFKGFGNPDLKSTDLDTIVAQIRASGIAAVRGNIVADVSYFDDLFWGEGWMWDDEPYSFEAFITPLSINDNCVKVVVSPGANHGDRALVTLDPPTTYVTLVNNAITVTDTVLIPLDVTRLFKERLNTIVVSGQIHRSSKPREYTLSVWKPELYAAQLLKESLEKSGIAVGGSTLIGTTPPAARAMARHVGRFDSMLVNLNKISDNLSAENTLKILGAEKRGTPGSARSGISETKLFLSQFGIDTTKFLMVDGSGVSHYNLLTAEMLVQLLVGMAHRPEWFPLFYASLPVAGVDGTLSNRMKGTPAEGNLRAKTGSISGVSSLSGYVTSLDGEMLAFSILMQHFIGGNRPFREVQDRIGARLAAFSRKRNPPLPSAHDR
jgi:D-alanyl-D-alanine carboxypeptidase/D-alanyl-D-alanine-endopeptidase (penicillin-binding protein 4)